MNLHEYQSLFGSFISGNNALTETAISLEMTPSRLNVYLDFVQDHLSGAIKKMYPRLLKLAPNLFTSELIRKYYTEFPPKSWEINQLAKNFPEFLESLEKIGSCTVYASELAQLEWAEFETFLNKEDERETVKSLGEGRLIINPTLTVLKFTHLLLPFIRTQEQAVSTIEKPKAENSIILLNRHPKTQLCVFTEPSNLGLQILDAINDQSNVEKVELLKWIVGSGFCNPKNVNDSTELFVFIADEVRLFVKQGVLLEGV